MRKIIILLILLVTNSVAYAQTSDLTAKRNAGFDKLTFEVELNKNSFLPFEPLLVKFKVFNQTKLPLAADNPQFLRDSVLKVTNSNGRIIEVNSLITSQGRALPLPGQIPILQPLQSYEEIKIPAIDSNVFSEPGKYKLQFILYGGTKPLESNVIEVAIEIPLGIDKDAFDYLNKNGKNVWFAPSFRENCFNLLRNFVDMYGESTYGKYAIKSLASYYFYKGELDKAQTEFEKIKDSQNKVIAEEAKRSLAEIENKKTALKNEKL